jgi:hypothetical protein
VATDIAMRGRTTLVPPPGPAYGADDPQKETKTGMYIFLGALGLMSIGYLMFGAKPQKGAR